MHVHLLHAEVGLAKLFFLDGLLTNNLATNDMGCTMNTIRKTFATCMALCAFTFLSPLVFADIEQQMGQLNADMAALERDISSLDRKSTRLNSSHVRISYAVFCLKKKKVL